MTQATTTSSTSSVADETMNSYPNALTVGQLAERVEGAVEGDHGVLILGVSGDIEDAEDGDIVYAENARFLSQAARSRASAIIAFLDATIPDKPLIKVSNPRYAFTRILELFKTPLNVSPGIHPSAVLGRGIEIGEEVSIGPHVTM